jgi:hypothetical protein
MGCRGKIKGSRNNNGERNDPRGCVFWGFR